MPAVCPWLDALVRISLLYGALFLSRDVVCAQNTVEILCSSLEQSRDVSMFSSILPSAKQLAVCSFDTDVYISNQEFEHMTGLAPGRVIDAATLARAVEALLKKNTFESVFCALTFDGNACSVRMVLRGVWTLARVRVKGPLWGRDVYKRAYLIREGERFDEHKHAHSLEKLIAILKDEGYGTCRVDARVIRDDRTHSIDVTLVLQRGPRFTIGTVEAEIHGKGPLVTWTKLCVDQWMKKRFPRKKLRAHYNQSWVKSHAAQLEAFLLQSGIVCAQVHVHEHVDMRGQCVHLLWNIDTTQAVRIQFLGNKFFSTKILAQCVAPFGKAAWLISSELLVEELVALYRTKGFWDVHIDVREEQGARLFIIREGMRIRIGSVDLVGADHFNAGILKKKVFGRLLQRRMYDDTLLQEACTRLIDHYVSQGFPDAHIPHYTCVPEREGHSFVLRVVVDEGSQRLLRGVTIEGQPQLSDMLVRWVTSHGLLNAPCTARMLERQRSFIERHTNRITLGSVTCSLEEQKKNDIFARWNLEKKRESRRFGKTIIQGSCPLPYEIIASCLAYREGQTWDQEKIRHTFARLKGMGVFDGIQIAPSRGSTADDYQDVVIALRHNHPVEVRLRIGTELQQVHHYHTIGGLTYRVGASFIAKNPSHAGDCARIDIDAAGAHREMTVRYDRPIVRALPLRLGIQAYHSQHNHPGFVGVARDVYRITQSGVLGGISLLDTGYECALYAGIESLKTRPYDDEGCDTQLVQLLAKALGFDESLLMRGSLQFFIEPTLFLEHLDSKVEPRRGLLTLLSAKAFIPIGVDCANQYFMKIFAEQACFFSIRNTVIALRLRLGHIFHRSFQSIAPSERFYLGGGHSLRGYEADMAPPLGVFHENGCERLIARGGKTMANINIELRFYLPKRIGLVGFQDIGILVGRDSFENLVDSVLASTGFGIRYQTPVGPLRFDIGWRWKKAHPLERSYAWFLTFGHAF